MPELEFAQAVAQHLGEGWEVKQVRQNEMRLQKDGTERLLLKGDDWTYWEKSDRVEVHGIFPGFDGQPVLSWRSGKRPFITCAKNRGPENLARAIEKRFLPRFWHRVEQAEQIVAGMQAGWDRRKANAQALSAILGVSVGNGRGQEVGPHDQLSVSLVGQGSLYGSIRVFEGSMTLTINSCPVDLALQIAQLIADSRE